MTAEHHDEVVALNLASEELTAPMDHARLVWMVSMCEIADVALIDGQVAGFVTVFGPGTDYDSRHYAWFRERYEPPFWYLDRIVVDERRRRSGVASAIYQSVETRASAAGVPVLLEVNLEPANDPSLLFHRRRGYRGVGEFQSKPDLRVMMFEYP